MVAPLRPSFWAAVIACALAMSCTCRTRPCDSNGSDSDSHATIWSYSAFVTSPPDTAALLTVNGAAASEHLHAERGRACRQACIGRVGEACKGKVRPCSTHTRPVPRQKLEEGSGAGRPVERALDVRAEEPPFLRRIGQATIGQSLDLDERERPERKAVVVEHFCTATRGSCKRCGGGAASFGRVACLCARLQNLVLTETRNGLFWGFKLG